jgi:hypothetical protein
MTKWYLKIWPLVLLTMVFVLVKLFIINPQQLKDNVSTRPEDIGEQKVLEEELSIEQAVQESEENIGIEGVTVPYYWKTGVDSEDGDYLMGYIPSIKKYQEYANLRQSMLTGVSNREKEEVSLSSITIGNDNYTLSNGISNSSNYFTWDRDSCSISYSDTLNSDIFLCYNWINWLGLSLEEKTFVLTKCSIDSTEGYCVFEDYIKNYHDSKKLGENRCIGDQRDNYLCDYDDYIKLIEFN